MTDIGFEEDRRPPILRAFPPHPTLMQSLKLTGQDIGNPARPGSTLPRADGYDLAGGGADIWMASDQFHFARTQWDGDSEFSARLTSLEPTHLYAKAGLMARATLEPGSPHV